MSGDPRVGAWLDAQALVVRAQEIRAQRDRHTAPRAAPEPLPEAYWLCLAEANVLAGLAQADDCAATVVIVTVEQRVPPRKRKPAPTSSTRLNPKGAGA